MHIHTRFMSQALIEARVAAEYNEVPIGAIVVNAQGEIIGRGYNQVMEQKSQHAHAEVLAIEQAGKTIDDWRLNGCTIYVTLEPCKMCYALIQLSRCDTLVFGANSPLFGFQLDNTSDHSVYRNNMLTIIQNVGAQESVMLLQNFFSNRRKKGMSSEDRSSEKDAFRAQTGT